MLNKKMASVRKMSLGFSVTAVKKNRWGCACDGRCGDGA